MTRIRITQIGTALLLATWWLASAGPASAMRLPPPDTDAGDPVAPVAAPTVVVHDHVSLWTYLLVAALAVAVTLAVVGLVRHLSRAVSERRSGRRSELAGPAAA